MKGQGIQGYDNQKLLGINDITSKYTGILCLISFCFIVLHRCDVFCKLKARPPRRTSQKSVTPFINILTLLQRSGTNPQYLLSKYACIKQTLLEIQEENN